MFSGHSAPPVLIFFGGLYQKNFDNQEAPGRALTDDPHIGTMLFYYDSNKNLITKTDSRNISINFEYDSINRLTRMLYPNDPERTFIYDTALNGKGHLAKVSQGDASIEYEYNKSGKVTKNIYTILAKKFTIQFNYNYLDKITSITYPNGQVASYEFVSPEKILKLSKVFLDDLEYASYDLNSYNARLQYTSSSLRNNVYTNLIYDIGGRLSRNTVLPANSNNPPLIDSSYSFDSIGNIINITDLRSNTIINEKETSATASYEYNQDSFLIKASGVYGTINYSYDVVGNIIFKDGLTFSYTNNHLISAGNKTYTYDAMGNIIQKQTETSSWNFSYNNENRMESILKNGEKYSSFLYDHEENRLLKTNYLQNGHILKTYYIGPYFELRELSTGALMHSVKLIVNDKLLASITKAGEVNLSSNNLILPIKNIGKYINIRFIQHHISFIKHYQLNYFMFLFLIMIFGFYLIFLGIKTKNFSHIKKKGWSLNWAKMTPFIVFLFTAQILFINCNGGGGNNTDQNGTAIQDNTNPSNEENSDDPVDTSNNPTIDDVQDFYENIKTEGSYINGMYYVDPQLANQLNSLNGMPLGTFFYHQDHLGSSSVITDATGKEVTRILYKPFGEIDTEHSTGLHVTTYKFTGQEYDEETDLYYYNARYYDPTIARFMTVDSIIPDRKDPISFNRYTYARNNPIIYTDPSGHNTLFYLYNAIIKLTQWIFARKQYLLMIRLALTQQGSSRISTTDKSFFEDLNNEYLEAKQKLERLIREYEEEKQRIKEEEERQERLERERKEIEENWLKETAKRIEEEERRKKESEKKRREREEQREREERRRREEQRARARESIERTRLRFYNGTYDCEWPSRCGIF